MRSASGGVGRVGQELVGDAVVGGRAGNDRGRQPEHEPVVALDLGGRVQLRHPNGVRQRRLGLGLGKARLRDRGDVAREVARRGLRLAAHVGGRELAQLRDRHQPLERVRLRREQLLAAQPDALDQPVHERVGTHVLERLRRRAVEAQERLRAVAPFGREVRALDREPGRRDHVELAPA